MGDAAHGREPVRAEPTENVHLHVASAESIAESATLAQAGWASSPPTPAVERLTEPTLAARSGRRGELRCSKGRSSFHTAQYHEATIFQEKGSRRGRGFAQRPVWVSGGRRRRRGCSWRNDVRLATALPCRHGHRSSFSHALSSRPGFTGLRYLQVALWWWG